VNSKDKEILIIIGMYGIICFLVLIVIFALFNNPIKSDTPLSNALALGIGLMVTGGIAIGVHKIGKEQSITINEMNEKHKVTQDRKNFYFSRLIDDFTNLGKMVDGISNVPKEVETDIFKNIFKYPNVQTLVYTYRGKDYLFPTPEFILRIKINIGKLEQDVDPQLVYKINEVLFVFESFYGGLSFILGRTQKTEVQLKKDIQERIIDMNESITKRVNVENMASQRQFNITEKVHTSLGKKFV